MKAGDLEIIAQIASIYPRMLPHLINIYRLGYKQGQIDLINRENSKIMDSLWGINLGNELKPSN